ncbi:heat shock transcription factor, X-linked member 4-like [Prorops nasuta]|uniref:heat shock transcription factor, X-linked member 4-like n=1 Tax=Prorops nasuta TaxID=863751 RepID=UPI0034CEE341
MQDVTLLSMKFPRKLWKIINECETGAIRWSNSGLSILLHYKKFQEEFLDPGNSVFKTSNITSFIRQLNLYGFRKVTSHNRDPICNAYNPDVHEFLHENFRSGRFDLLYKVCRKTNAKKSKNLVNRLPQKNSTLRRSPNQQRSTTSPISRLKKCQLALTETLEQIIQKSREEKQEKFVETPKEHMNFPSTGRLENNIIFYIRDINYTYVNLSIIF